MCAIIIIPTGQSNESNFFILNMSDLSEEVYSISQCFLSKGIQLGGLDFVILLCPDHNGPIRQGRYPHRNVAKIVYCVIFDYTAGQNTRLLNMISNASFFHPRRLRKMMTAVVVSGCPHWNTMTTAVARLTSLSRTI